MEEDLILTWPLVTSCLFPYDEMPKVMMKKTDFITLECKEVGKTKINTAKENITGKMRTPHLRYINVASKDDSQNPVERSILLRGTLTHFQGL